LICAFPDYLHKLPTRTLYATTAHRTQSAKVRTVLDFLMRCFGEEKGLIKSAEN
jgi:transcriptional regulator, lysR family